MSETKRCFKCEKDLPRSEFYAHKQMSEGLLGKCKECTKSDVRSNRLRRVEYYREYDRKRGWHGKKHYRTREQARAHSQVARAVRSGKLERGRCSVCGSWEHIHAHHDDYSRPLDVVWLCPIHHKLMHKAMKAAESF